MKTKKYPKWWGLIIVLLAFFGLFVSFFIGTVVLLIFGVIILIIERVDRTKNSQKIHKEA